MKLYTEEQVNKMISRARLHSHDDSEMFTDDYLISCETPIELPSDEDIYSILRGKKMFEKDWGFIEGAKWMREQILGKDDKTFKQKSKWTEVDNMTRRLK